jgi:hypothetical protein
MCQNYQGRENIGGANVALKCARLTKIDWETSEVGQCAGIDGSGTGEEGIALLKESVQATKALEIEYVLVRITRDRASCLSRKSCTILINGKQVCVRDGEWKQCEVCATRSQLLAVNLCLANRMDTKQPTLFGRSRRNTGN